MSERDIVERLNDRCSWGDARLVMPHDPVSAEAAAEILRLRAELADAKRAGWIAGRDAAAEVLTGVHGSGVPNNPADWAMGVEDALHAIRKAIRNMEPPA